MGQREKSQIIINSATASAIGAALIPFPIADTIMISGIQVAMIIGISSVYDKPINKDTAKGLVGAYGAANVGMWLASLAKGIPGAGTLVGEIAQPIIAGALTAALGLAYRSMSEKNIPISADNLKKEAKKHKDEGKNMASEQRQKAENTKQKTSSINFHADYPTFSNDTNLYFNLSHLSNPKIEIKNVDADLVWSCSLNSNQGSVNWSPDGIPPGKYFAFLMADEIVPIILELHKR